MEGKKEIPVVLDFAALTEDQILEVLQYYRLQLSPHEALIIQNQILKRPPTYTECVLWSIQGSEHCSYKSSRPHLQKFNVKGDHVILGPREDAGIVEVAKDTLGNRYGIVMSHESHNHPSQIVPYEGAATGVGGNVRDVSCMGAEVIAIADSLRFGDLQHPKTKWIHEGVVKGIGGYANPLGIPTIAGDTYYDQAYNENCLVTVITLGTVRADQIIHSYAPAQAQDYQFILVGKATDNSGFGGAAFASINLSAENEEENKGAVQEPNAFLQRHLLKANEALFHWLRENNLTTEVGFKDLGAGGIACASVELADSAGFGADIDINKIPTSMANLDPAVILCSETQERFMWIVPEHLVGQILDHYNQKFALPELAEGAQAVVIGRIRPDGIYSARYHGQEVVCAQAADITRGLSYNRPFFKKVKNLSEPKLQLPANYNQILIDLLSHENIASRAAIYESYDKQVQGRTFFEAGWADAGIMLPFNEDKYPLEIQKTAIALTVDQNPRFCKIDAYWGAVNAVFEAVRNIVAVGAWPLAITDCLCFGNPEDPEQMGEFVSSIEGIVDACGAIRMLDNPNDTLPVISGNVSFYNSSAQGTIPPSPIIGCLGATADVSSIISLDFKRAQSVILLVGERKDECGGSIYYQLYNQLGAQLPKPDFHEFYQQVKLVYQAIHQGLVLAAHDIAEGGIVVALAEMSFKHKMGVEVRIPSALNPEKMLFSETGGFILEVCPTRLVEIQHLFKNAGVHFSVIGETTQTAQLNIQDLINLPLDQAFEAWSQGLRRKLMHEYN